MQRDGEIVLGYIHGYRWEDISEFVDSLRSTGFAGEILFFCGGIGPEHMEEIRSHGVSLQPVAYDSEQRQLSARWWKLLRWGPAVLRLRALRKLAHFMVFRFFCYHRFLQKHGHHYRAVLISDVRDVWFQTNPFATVLAGGAHVFEEMAGRTLGDEPYNRRWLLQLFGPRYLARVAHQSILCSGTIMGDIPAMRALLEQFIQTAAKARVIYGPGLDQGIFNRAIRSFSQPSLQIHPNGSSAVLTMGIMPPEAIRFNRLGQVIGLTGEPVPILHQFDRHPGLLATWKASQPWNESSLPVQPDLCSL